MPALFRRRLVLLPTLWGWLGMATLLLALSVLAGRAAGPWLALTAPARAPDGSAAKVLIVEGWLGRTELEAAAAYARQHGMQRVIASGGPDDDSFEPFRTYAERAASVMRPLLPGVPVDAVPSPETARDRTYASALSVREWMEQRQLPREAIDVYTRGVHARRTRWLYQMAFGDTTAAGVIAGRPPHADETRWWTSSRGARVVMGEALGLAWMTCCFWPSPAGKRELSSGASDRAFPWRLAGNGTSLPPSGLHASN